MKQIDNYIVEKLHINKDSKYNDPLPDEEEFCDTLSEFGELELEKVFGKDLPYDEKERDIETIYVQNINGKDVMYYSYDNGSLESELDLDVFSDEQIIKIYDYMCNN